MLRTIRTAVLLVASLSLTAAGVPADRYNLDTSHTSIGFTVRHMMVSNVPGRFTKFEGYVLLDERDITRSTAEITIDAASVDTDNTRRDDHLRSADFFDVAKYPQIRFVGTHVERTADGPVLIGSLTMKDVTKPVRIPFELRGPVAVGQASKRMGAEGELRINRKEFGLTWNRVTEGVNVVGDEVRIQLNIEAVHATTAAGE